ncbi:hypothetical protein D7030_09730 [Flavobacteriaceae bacterium AU392]|nr:hypothetical protein D1817_07080 [Flavobacteriaceae bacterium]RKM83567.1 hypothetical protein D7030_09730 [Flavobacteriaceae bacterium AU392]
MLSFTETKNVIHKIKIVNSSEQLSVSEFILKEGKTELKTGKDYTFYVNVKSKNIKGKILNNDYTKTKRKGVEYKVTYVYEYESGPGKYQKSNQIFWIWDDGDITKPFTPEHINVGKITLKTQVERTDNM